MRTNTWRSVFSMLLLLGLCVGALSACDTPSESPHSNEGLCFGDPREYCGAGNWACCITEASPYERICAPPEECLVAGGDADPSDSIPDRGVDQSVDASASFDMHFDTATPPDAELSDVLEDVAPTPDVSLDVTPDGEKPYPDADIDATPPDMKVPDPDRGLEFDLGLPGPEQCNGLDDDRDGETDEGFRLGEPCAAGSGRCASVGERVCGDDGRAICNAEPRPELSQDEVCNRIDDDCDGRMDERLGGNPCEHPVDVNEDICILAGLEVCQEGEIVCEPRPVVELCDHIDHDCDSDPAGLDCEPVAPEGHDIVLFVRPHTNFVVPCEVGGGSCLNVVGPDASIVQITIAETCQLDGDSWIPFDGDCFVRLDDESVLSWFDAPEWSMQVGMLPTDGNEPNNFVLWREGHRPSVKVERVADGQIDWTFTATPGDLVIRGTDHEGDLRSAEGAFVVLSMMQRQNPEGGVLLEAHVDGHTVGLPLDQAPVLGDGTVFQVGRDSNVNRFIRAHIEWALVTSSRE